MKRNNPNVSIPPHDYRLALLGALSWLGDRYLLAQPAIRLAQPQTPYFTESPRWHPVLITGALEKL